MRLFLACLVSLAAAACAPQGIANPPAEVSGTVSSLEATALPADAVITLRLDDVSRADAPSDLLAEVEIQVAGRQLPLPFRIAYDPGQIQTGHTYTVSARITSEGRLIMMSTQSFPVITKGPTGNVGIVVDPLRFRADDAAPAPAPLERTTWVLTEIGGKPVTLPEDRSATLVLVPTDNRLATSAGCNRLMGTYQLKGRSLSFSQVAGTRMACPEPLMAQEQALIEALGRTDGFRVTGNRLELMAGATPVARLEAADQP